MIDRRYIACVRIPPILSSRILLRLVCIYYYIVYNDIKEKKCIRITQLVYVLFDFIACYGIKIRLPNRGIRFGICVFIAYLYIILYLGTMCV